MIIKKISSMIAILSLTSSFYAVPVLAQTYVGNWQNYTASDNSFSVDFPRDNFPWPDIREFETMQTPNGANAPVRMRIVVDYLNSGQSYWITSFETTNWPAAWHINSNHEATRIIEAIFPDSSLVDMDFNYTSNSYTFLIQTDQGYILGQTISPNDKLFIVWTPFSRQFPLNDAAFSEFVDSFFVR